MNLIILSIIDRFIEVWNKPKIQWTSGDEVIYYVSIAAIALAVLIVIAIIIGIGEAINHLKKKK